VLAGSDPCGKSLAVNGTVGLSPGVARALHSDEIPIDAELGRALVGRAMPDYVDASVRPVGIEWLDERAVPSRRRVPRAVATPTRRIGDYLEGGHMAASTGSHRTGHETRSERWQI
jgi:hypothetical protein